MADASSDKFEGTDSEARSFCRWLNLYHEGKLKPTNGASKRERKPGFPEVEEALVDYIFQHDKLGISRQIMKDKAMEYADMLAKGGVQELHNFKASDSWITNVLERNGLSGMNLHGEAGEMTEEKLSVTEMEAMLKRIRTSVVEYGVWNETKKFLDVKKIMKNIRRASTQKASVGRQQSTPTLTHNPENEMSEKCMEMDGRV